MNRTSYTTWWKGKGTQKSVIFGPKGPKEMYMKKKVGNPINLQVVGYQPSDRTVTQLIFKMWAISHQTGKLYPNGEP